MHVAKVSNCRLADLDFVWCLNIDSVNLPIDVDRLLLIIALLSVLHVIQILQPRQAIHAGLTDVRNLEVAMQGCCELEY